jgi:hypothetical protein
VDNVVTVQVRVFLRHAGHVPPIDVYLPLLYNSRRGSYFVPERIRQNFIDPYIDIQFGARNYPEGVMRLWEDCKEYFDSIWVRYFSEDNDFDYIFSISDNGKTPDRQARYAFDHLRVTWLPTDVPPVSAISQRDLKWRTRNDLWGLNTEGSYLAANYRGELCHGDSALRPGIGTLTSSACLMSGGMRWSYYGLQPTSLASFAEQFSHSFKKVEFYWRRRLVRADIIHPEEPRWGWSFFSLDDWDNLIDPEYLHYKQNYFQQAS